MTKSKSTKLSPATQAAIDSARHVNYVIDSAHAALDRLEAQL